MTVAIVVIDAAFMREQILAHPAIPHFDQAQYVEKAITGDGRGNDRVALMALVIDDFPDNGGLQRGSREGFDLEIVTGQAISTLQAHRFYTSTGAIHTSTIGVGLAGERCCVASLLPQKGLARALKHGGRHFT